MIIGQADPVFRFYYVVDGATKLRFPDKTLLLKADNLYLIPANVPFVYVQASPLHHYWLHFCSSLLEKLPVFNDLFTVPADAVPDVSGMMQCFLSLADNPGQIGNIMQMDIILRQLLFPFLALSPMEGYSHMINQLEDFAPVLQYIETQPPAPSKATGS